MGEARADREPIDGISERKDHDTKLGHRQARSFVVDGCHSTGGWATIGIRSRFHQPTPWAADNFKYTLGGLLTSGQFLFV
jgi:hypothetical protein